MYDFELTRETTASAADVWAIYADVTGWPSWNGTLKAAWLGGDFESDTAGAYHSGGIMAPFAFLNAASARGSVPIAMERIAHFAERRAARG